MVEQIVRSEVPIHFDYAGFARWHIPTSIGLDKPLSPPQGGAASTDEEASSQDAKDAVQPITDELFKNPLWWIVEILPLSYTYQNPRGDWKTTWW
jgi:hypothetical protein